MTSTRSFSTLELQRHTERGAALFVVVMVVTLLTAVGLFAARSTSLVDAATGYARQSAQTIALADYGSRLVASELGEGRAMRIFQLMDTRNQYCPTYAGSTGQPCYAYDSSQLDARVYLNTTNTSHVIESQKNDRDGSLGPMFTAASNGVDGLLTVELFDAFEISNIQGESAAKPSGREVTINSIAQIRPFRNNTSDTAAWCSAANATLATAASLLSVRAQVIVPLL